jgi:dipeptide transport system ATP-binding protein
MALLDIQNLNVDFKTSSGWFRAVDGVSLQVAMLAVMGLLPKTARVTADKIDFDGHNFLTISEADRRNIIGKDIAMVFQEPMTSLNPSLKIGYQLGEALKHHLGSDKQQQKQRVLELLSAVGIPDPESRLNAYPHQFSGGMAQRVMIAIALACKPKLIIADEPTTALDVTIQAQILDLLTALQRDHKMTLILITHSMGVVAETAESVSVHYAGQKVEEQTVTNLFTRPRHPYTAALLTSLPERATSRKLSSIPGTVPGQFDRPAGCLFSPRCCHVQDLCKREAPPLKNNVLCHFPLQGGAS